MKAPPKTTCQPLYGSDVHWVSQALGSRRHGEDHQKPGRAGKQAISRLCGFVPGRKGSLGCE